MVDVLGSAAQWWAIHAGGWSARLATRILIRRLMDRDGNIDIDGPVRLARVLWRGRDQRVLRLAEAGLERVWTKSLERGQHHSLWYSVSEAADGDPPPAVTRLLLADPDLGSFKTRVEWMARLDFTDDVGPVVVGWLGSPEIVDLLRVTSHRQLLVAVEHAYIAAMGSGADRMWIGDEATPLMRIVLDNRHLPQRPEHPSYLRTSSNETQWALAFMAILKDRRDFLDHLEAPSVVDRLAEAAALPLPSAVVAACRQTLRELPHSSWHERLCELAISGDAEARAAVVESDLEPKSCRRLALFLFCTEQWERYDEYDPLGERLRRRRKEYTEQEWTRLREVAARTGRRCPPQPPPRPPQPVPFSVTLDILARRPDRNPFGTLLPPPPRNTDHRDGV